jgi:hypothetical protein
MMSTKQFHIGDLLSITTGRLVSPSHIGGVYDVIDFVTGQAHMTHQLVRASKEIEPHLIEQHGWLKGVSIPDDVQGEPAVIAWLAWAANEYGEYHDVAALPEGAYVGREPLAELREMAPHAEIITVDMDEFGKP